MKKKILYLSRLDPNDIKSWSGVTQHIQTALKKNFEVITVGPLSNRVRVFYILKRFFYSFFKIKFDIDRPILVAKDFAHQIKKKIKNISYDAVLTSDSYLLSFFDTNKPCFIFVDVLFSTYYSHYFTDIKIHRKTLQEGNYCQKIALDKANKVILTSRWAIKDAIKSYKIKPHKLNYLPFGPSLKFIPRTSDIKKAITKKNFDICKLVSVGVHWDRKGMDKAVSVVAEMNKIGHKTILYIIGAKPPKNFSNSKNVIIVDFLDKNIPKDLKILKNFFYKAHFNLLFSKSEAFGVVNVEASAFGLYTITNNVGGIDGAITNNVNGYMFGVNHPAPDIAAHILKIFTNKKTFFQKSIMSRNQYDKKLKWDRISQKLCKIIKKNI